MQDPYVGFQDPAWLHTRNHKRLVAKDCSQQFHCTYLASPRLASVCWTFLLHWGRLVAQGVVGDANAHGLTCKRIVAVGLHEN